MTAHSESLLLEALRCETPEKEALIFQSRRITYGELRESVGRIMTALRRKNIGRGDRVAIWLNKSPESVFLILATMGVGAAYVPIDPGAPASRVVTLLDDCQPALLFAGERNLNRLDAPQGLATESVALRETNAGYDLGALTCEIPSGDAQIGGRDELAAILYTSGSTGTPKGVMLSHGNISNFVGWAVGAFDLRPEDRFSSHAPFHFDLSTFDLFAAFHVGATVCLLDEISVKFPAAVLKVLLEEGVTVWYSVPTALRMLVEHGMTAEQQIHRLRLVLFAGEVFQPVALNTVMAAFPDADFFNLYGPTETNVCTFYKVPRPLPPDTLSIPVGVPCPPLEVEICDEAGRGVPDGSSGEICVSGPGVMLGYWGHQSLTEQKRLNGREDSYRTGDYGYRMPDGNIMFTGRKDNQVKFRGYRIELLEIEAVISSHPDIKEAVAVVTRNEQGEQLLNVVAIACSGSAKPGKADLARYIAGKLPSYCIPDDVIWREEMPRTSTGKVDRNRLFQASSP